MNKAANKPAVFALLLPFTDLLNDIVLIARNHLQGSIRFDIALNIINHMDRDIERVVFMRTIDNDISRIIKEVILMKKREN